MSAIKIELQTMEKREVVGFLCLCASNIVIKYKFHLLQIPINEYHQKCVANQHFANFVTYRYCQYEKKNSPDAIETQRLRKQTKLRKSAALENRLEVCNRL